MDLPGTRHYQYGTAGKILSVYEAWLELCWNELNKDGGDNVENA